MNLWEQSILFDGYDVISFIHLTDEEKRMVREWRNSTTIRKWMYNDAPILLSSHLSFIDGLAERSDVYYGLVKHIESGEYLGVVYLSRINSQLQNAYLGIYTRPDAPKGGGKILMDVLMHIAFNVLEFHSLKLEVIKNNSRAYDFYQKCGFVEEGCLREYVIKDGVWQDVLIMGMLASECESK